MLTASSRHRHAVRTLALLSAVTLGACRDTSTATEPAVSLARRAANSSIAVTLGGLPSGTPGSVRVTGGGGYTANVTGSTTLTGLANGTYTFVAANVSAGGVVYAATPATQSVSVSKGSTGRATINYAAAPTTGTLNVTVTVPNGAPGAVTVTGAGGFSQVITTSTTIPTLAPGSYTIAAAPITSSSIVYSPTPASQVVSVTAGSATSAAVTYASTSVVPSPDLNVQIFGMSLVQSVQKLDNSVPLITGRTGVLRVYAVATVANTATPSVRVRLFQNGALVSTLTAAAGGASVPTAPNEASATASWNVTIPGALVQPGLSVLADVDPDNTVPEANETDNSFPITGQPQTLTVRTVPPLNIRFVPVTQASTMATGNISTANAEQFLTLSRDALPVGSLTYNVRAPYTTSNVLLADGGGWEATLNEVYALRSTDRSTDHYYGVVKTSYGSGVVGMGYYAAPGSIGWDVLPNGPETVAHELGHNFNRRHAPCGNVSGADATFPYAGGISGVFGFNVRLNRVMASSTADMMGYCSPRWISDYNYNAMMNFRGYTTAAGTGSIGANEDASIVTGSSATDGLLVWGRVGGDGAIVLEPAIRLTAPTQLPARAGDFTLTASDAAGRVLFSTTFTPLEVADAPGGGAQFAFVIPMSETAHVQLARLTVSGRGRSAERTSRQPESARLAEAAAADIGSESADRTRVKWDAASFPMVVVRDAETGQILSFARGGNAAVQTRKANVDLTYTDGVRSTTTRVRVRGR